MRYGLCAMRYGLCATRYEPRVRMSPLNIRL
jgi:hypothetical protein